MGSRKKQPQAPAMPAGFTDELMKPARANYSERLLVLCKMHRDFVREFAKGIASDREKAKKDVLAKAATLFANELSTLKSIAERKETVAEDVVKLGWLWQ